MNLMKYRLSFASRDDRTCPEALLALAGSSFFAVLLALAVIASHRKPLADSHSFRSEISWQRQDCRSREPLERHLFQTQLRNVEPEVATSLAHHFVWLCKRHHFDPLFVAALIGVESGFNPDAVSPRGAIGLMQIMPTTASQLMARDGVEVDEANLTAQLSDPFFNLTLGMKYLAQLRDHFRGSAQNFLSAYHGGPARVDDVLTGKRQPLLASQEYVRSIRIGLGLFRLQVPRSCRESIPLAMAGSGKI